MEESRWRGIELLLLFETVRDWRLWGDAEGRVKDMVREWDGGGDLDLGRAVLEVLEPTVVLEVVVVIVAVVVVAVVEVDVFGCIGEPAGVAATNGTALS